MDISPQIAELARSYDYRLVALSVVLAVFAAYTTLDLGGRVTAAKGGARLCWLTGGATAMGVGIWAMHYIGMLAFSLPVPVLYDYPTVVLSLVAAVAASAVGLFTVSRERLGAFNLMLGSTAMGSGIAVMHYTGMAAMRLPAAMHYDLGRVAFSVFLAIGISLTALIFCFRERQELRVGVKALSALILGSAIPLMHYTGMWAVRFYPSSAPMETAHAIRISAMGISVISISSVVILVLTMATAFADRLVAREKTLGEAAREGEDRFRMLAEAIPEIVWTATIQGKCDYCNQRWYELTGLTEEQMLTGGWKEALHPDDYFAFQQAWERALQTGEAIEGEYRLRDRNGDYRWHLARATPMRDTRGLIIKWFGACTDIEAQMNTQKELETRIQEHTSALIEANARLEDEMRERALTQQELNQQNEHMLKELTRRSHRATMLAKMGELLQSCVSLRDAFAVIVGMAPKVFPELRGAIMVFDSSRKLLEVKGEWSGCELPAKVFEPLDCWAVRTGHLHFVEAGDRTAECLHIAASERSYLCVPILAQAEVIGAVHFQFLEGQTLAKSDFPLASTFAEQIGLSVANIRLREALRGQSIRDPLTGLYNRRYLEESLEREIRRAARAAQNLGVLMLDLDHFKNFNDTYGHEAGDTVLRETGGALTAGIRAEDIACRYGGEEFVVILPTASLEATFCRAERLRARIREIHAYHQGRSLGIITVSIGVAAFPLNGASAKGLLAAADAALYEAKRLGRDRVVRATCLEKGEVGEGEEISDAVPILSENEDRNTGLTPDGQARAEALP
jgi:diguanylate cyclase (GGDEF)-like protein/PAS domain S-box-containing protein